MPNMTGRCLCGQVHYTANAEPVAMMACHCKTGQRHSGTAFSTLVVVPREAVTVTGNLKTYTEPGGTSGEPMHRRFCPDCGSPVIFEREGSPRIIIAAGTLDETSFVKPTMNIFCESAQSWVPLSPDTQNFLRYSQ
jgi:hypothetical protein